MLALLMLVAQDPAQEARGLVHRVYEDGRLSLRFSGARALQVDGRLYRAEGLDATLYTSPKPGDPTATRIDVRAREGTFDSIAWLLTFRGEVALLSGSGDDLRSDELVVSRVVEGRKVIDFKLGAPGPFTLKRPRLVVSGVGLDAFHRSLDMTIESDGRIEIEGEPRDIQRGSTEPSNTKTVTVVQSAGQITIVEKPDGTIEMKIPGACSMAQEERALENGEWVLKRSSTLTSSSATFYAARVPDPADDPISRAAALGWLREEDVPFEKATLAELADAGFLTPTQAVDLAGATPTLLQITWVKAEGNVQLAGAAGEQALCDVLEWDRLHGNTRLKNNTGQVQVIQGGNDIHADDVRVDHGSGKAVCEGNVVALLRQEAGGPITNITAEMLQMEGRGPATEAPGTPSVTFQPDVLTVRSRGFSELVTDRVRIRAPIINYDPVSGRSVVGGPKTIELKKFDAEGRELPPVRVTCEGIAVLDRGEPPKDPMDPRIGVITLEDSVRMIDGNVTSEADRTVINLLEWTRPEPRSQTRVRSYGHVRIRKDGGDQIAADFTDYDMATGDMTVEGYPTAGIRRGDSDLLHTETTINIESESLITAPTDERVRIVVPRRKKP